MAKALMGPTVIGLRGTIGGITFSSNSSGPYAKAFARPPYNAGPHMQLPRGLLVSTARGYAALTPAEKAAWAAYALAPVEPDYDPWGSLRYLSGFQWWQRAGLRRQAMGDAPTATVPTSAMTAPAGCTLTADHVGGPLSVVLGWTAATFAANEYAAGYIAIRSGGGLQYSTTGYRSILQTKTPGNASEDITTAVYNAYGDPPVGSLLFCRLWKGAPLGNRSPVVNLRAVMT
jgi:hypothetical protein